MTYYPRTIDVYLQEWANQKYHKPVLLRGARQVGKSSATDVPAVKINVEAA